MSNLHAKDPKRYGVQRLCALFGVSKQAYYKRDEANILKKVAQESFALEYIKGIRVKDPGIGGMKLWYMYRRDRFVEIVDKYGLKVRMKIRKPKTTDSSHGLPTYPNIIKDFIPAAPNQLWFSDITYITMWLDEYHYVFYYLSLVMDAYTEEIVGWSVGPTLETCYPVEALKMALTRIEGKNDIELIHHSDRGYQYASSEYVRLLEGMNIRISMTESGDPKDNAQAERVNNTMKNELLRGMRFNSIDDVQVAVSKAVDFYNNERPHMSIDMMTPAQAAMHNGEIAKRWFSYRTQEIKNNHPSLEITEKGLPLPAPQGLTGGRARKETLGRDKNQKDNLYQG